MFPCPLLTRRREVFKHLRISFILILKLNFFSADKRRVRITASSFIKWHLPNGVQNTTDRSRKNWWVAGSNMKKKIIFEPPYSPLGTLTMYPTSIWPPSPIQSSCTFFYLLSFFILLSIVQITNNNTKTLRHLYCYL